MSLNDFVERPALKEAFDRFAVRMPLSAETRKLEMLVPPYDKRRASFVGMAFDYMARFRLARDVIERHYDDGIEIHQRTWGAEYGVQAMAHHAEYAPAAPSWRKLVNRATDLFRDFAEGKDIETERVAICCQYLAAVEMLHRRGEMNPNFRHSDTVTKELVALDSVFCPTNLFEPRRQVLLSPEFNNSEEVGGADADFTVDGTIVDVKTTIKLAAGVGHLRQLAGQAALQNIGGFKDREPQEVSAVAIYFSRHGLVHRCKLDKLFPNKGFPLYVDAFQEELKHMREYEQEPSPRPM